MPLVNVSRALQSLSLATLIVGAAAALFSPSPAQAGDRALLIGISRYQLPEYHLRGPRADLITMGFVAQDTLGFAQSEIRTLRDANATRANIVASIQEWLIDGTEPGDRVLLYFSGHGTQVRDFDFDEADGRDEALAPYDIGYAQENALIDDQLVALLDQLTGRRVIVIVDACHSGTITRSVGPSALQPIPGTRFIPPTAIGPTAGGGASGARSAWARSASRDQGMVEGGPSDMVVFSAAAEYQLAWETSINGEVQGSFTFALQEGLLTRPDASHSRIYEHVKRRSLEICNRIPQCANQALDQKPTPQLEVSSRDLHQMPFGRWNREPVFAQQQPTQQPQPQAQQTPSTPAQPEVETQLPADGPLSSPEIPQQAEQTPEPSGPTVAVSEPTPIEVVQETLVAPSDSIELSVSPSPLRAGQPVAFTVTSSVPGEIILFSVDPDGAVAVLYPGPAGSVRTRGPRTSVTFPDENAGQVFIAEPGASGTLFAVVAHDSLDVNAVVDDLRAGRLTGAGDFSAELADRLNRVIVGEVNSAGVAERRNARWATTSLTFSVSR